MYFVLTLVLFVVMADSTPEDLKEILLREDIEESIRDALYKKEGFNAEMVVGAQTVGDVGMALLPERSILNMGVNLTLLGL